MKAILILALAFGMSAFAQTPVKTLKKDISLQLQSASGTNGISVAYNPHLNVYYSVFAGNASFPLEVHNAVTGQSISSWEVGADIRGMWYNPKKKMLEGILVGNEGSYTMAVTEAGPSSPETTGIAYGMDFNDIARFHNKKVYFLNGNGLTVFKQGKLKAVKNVYPEAFGTQGVDNFNTYGFFHTGVKGYEIGVYNSVEKKIYLFSEANGKTAAVVDIAFDKEYLELNRFKIAYANQRVFLYDVDSRSWDGYKLF